MRLARNKFLAEKKSALMKPEELAEGHQTLFSSLEGGVWARDYFNIGTLCFSKYIFDVGNAVSISTVCK